MKIVRESINFERGQDPKTSMGIGMYEIIKKYADSIYPSKNYTEKEDFLWVCSGHSKLEYVKYLIDSGVNIHAYYDKALRIAAREGSLGIVKALIDAGANIHTDNDRPLRLAMVSGHANVMEYLLESGADVRVINDEDLRLAKYQKHPDVIKVVKDWIKKGKAQIRESINFERGQDPKSSMRLGRIGKIKEWMVLAGCETFSVDEDGYINVSEDLSFSSDDSDALFPGGKFPDYIKFKNTLSFDIDNCGLISLIGCPQMVEGYFSCSQNDLDSLIGFPKKVIGNVFCYGNSIEIKDQDIEEICEVDGGISSDEEYIFG